jgi:pimeloyl-ACP methyl ester carboxylesterase
MKQSYDDQGVRYTLVTTMGGREEINWIFIPGGPGADSRYLKSLIDILSLPGNIWLIDLPGNGDNASPNSYDFHQWLRLIPEIASRFDNCIIVGHSLGGMLPLLTPELESKLTGLVIINSSPSLWMEEAHRLSAQHKLPDLPERKAFFQNRSQENYDQLLKASIPYYFNKDAVEQGYQLFQDVPFPVDTALKVLGIMQNIKYNAQWIPHDVPTLIIGGDQDYINPYILYEKDTRFDRQNIRKVLINGCGHWCWIEKPDAVSAAVSSYILEMVNPHNLLNLS